MRATHCRSAGGLLAKCTCALKRFEKVHQVRHFIGCQAHLEPLIVKCDYLIQRVCSAVLEIRCMPSESAEDGPLEFPNIGTKAGNQGPAGVCRFNAHI